MKSEVKEGEYLLCFIKRSKLVEYKHWKISPDMLELNSIDRKRPGKKNRRARQEKIGWIDNTKCVRWTDGGLEVAREVVNGLTETMTTQEDVVLQEMPY